MFGQNLHGVSEGYGLPRPLKHIEDFMAVLPQKLVHNIRRAGAFVQKVSAEAGDFRRALKLMGFECAAARLTKDVPDRFLIVAPEKFKSTGEPQIPRT
tara:strand:+ start:2047 stop:2340 length:294 start_codon:yes stop_codon:yes gene_type:complete